MAREYWNEMPGDLADESADNLPGGFGTDDPDRDIDATIDELIDNDVIGPTGQAFIRTGETGGSTSGTAYAEGTNTGSTVDPADLLEGEEAHPGAAVGFTGEERSKQVPDWAQTAEPHYPTPESGAGGPQPEVRSEQQAQNRTTESREAGGTQGAAGDVDTGEQRAA